MGGEYVDEASLCAYGGSDISLHELIVALFLQFVVLVAESFDFEFALLEPFADVIGLLFAPACDESFL